MGILFFFVIFLKVSFKEKMKGKGEKFSDLFCFVFSIENKKREGKRRKKGRGHGAKTKICQQRKGVLP
ncbi:hypothetical protein D7V86_06170 [bacterium D16-51]|nr:hypothetical protein D7V96_06505 [bacterium D16-59]RKI61360.1 hypothetical protein D7V86_06170 [bacterium D16-51]